MTKTTWLGVGLAAMSLAASGLVMAQQGPPLLSADATFRSNPSNCIESEVQVFVRGAANARGKIEASVVEVDYCKDQTLLDAQAKTNLASGALSLNGSNVVLDTTVQMLDAVTRNPMSMKFVIQWIGGEAIVATTRFDVEAPGKAVRLNRPAKRTLLLARASGSVSSNGQNYVDGPADDAAITLAR